MNPKNLMPTMADSSDSFLKDVLASASLDQPPPEAKNATLAALGLAVPAAVVATTVVAAAAASTNSVGAMAAAGTASTTAAVVSSSSGTVTKVAAVSAFGATKWIAGGVALLAIASGVAYGVRHTSSSPEGAPSSAPSTQARASLPKQEGLSVTTATSPVVNSPVLDEAKAPLPSIPATQSPSVQVRTPAPVVSVKAPEEPKASAAPAPQSARTSTLARETALLSEVREAIAAGDMATARTRLHAYDAEFPDGMLRREATVLRDRLPAP